MSDISSNSFIVDMLRRANIMNTSVCEILTVIFCAFIVLLCLKLARQSSILSKFISLSAISLLLSFLYLLMDAPDVAITEAALGACLCSCVFLSFLKTIKDKELQKEIKSNSRKKIYASCFCLSFIIIMSFLSLELHPYGQIDSPVQVNLTRYYIENTHREINIHSMVTSILASYRGFDTLGETLVILIGGIGTLLLLSKENLELKMQLGGTKSNLRKHIILKRVSGFIFSFIILYSFFVQLNGENSPGGGFQAGVIFASGIICYDLIYGDITKYLSLKLQIFTGALGVLIYAILGMFSLIFGDNYLNYYSLSLPNTYIEGQHLCIFIVEIGVGFTVASVLSLIYCCFQKT